MRAKNKAVIYDYFVVAEGDAGFSVLLGPYPDDKEAYAAGKAASPPGRWGIGRFRQPHSIVAGRELVRRA